MSRAEREEVRRVVRRVWWARRRVREEEVCGVEVEGGCGGRRVGWWGVVFVVVFVFADVGSGGGEEIGWVAGSVVGSVGGGDGALVIGGMGEGVGFGLKGVLRGDLKGWERVFVAVFRRRRLEGWRGDMFDTCVMGS